MEIKGLLDMPSCLHPQRHITSSQHPLGHSELSVSIRSWTPYLPLLVACCVYCSLRWSFTHACVFVLRLLSAHKRVKILPAELTGLPAHILEMPPEGS